jgi:hypothetical protein
MSNKTDKADVERTKCTKPKSFAESAYSYLRAGATQLYVIYTTSNGINKLTFYSAISPYALLEDLNAQEAQSINATRLNAFTLNVLSAVDILWTLNVSRHMLLTEVGGGYVLELFSLPCAFDAVASPAVGIPIELTQEIEESYAVLFNAWSNAPFHAKFGAFVDLRRVCWCWSCSAYRYRQQCINVASNLLASGCSS